MDQILVQFLGYYVLQSGYSPFSLSYEEKFNQNGFGFFFFCFFTVVFFMD